MLMFLVCPAYGAVEVAFIEVRDHQDQLVQLEQNGRFAHVAISYKGQWLHAHPYHGVELSSLDALEKMGKIIRVFIQDALEPSRPQLESYLGQPYNRSFEWSGQGFYCSQLVAKLLNIAPEPMKFYGDIWRGWTPGDLGISPDDLYRLLEKRFRYRCESVLR